MTGIQGNPPSPPMGDALAAVMGEHESSASQPASSGTEASGSVNSVAPNNDAFQIAELEIANSSIGTGQTIVLSTSPTTLGTALQQTFQQVGFGADALHGLRDAETLHQQMMLVLLMRAQASPPKLLRYPWRKAR